MTSSNVLLWSPTDIIKVPDSIAGWSALLIKDISSIERFQDNVFGRLFGKYTLSNFLNLFTSGLTVQYKSEIYFKINH